MRFILFNDKTGEKITESENFKDMVNLALHYLYEDDKSFYEYGWDDNYQIRLNGLKETFIVGRSSRYLIYNDDAFSQKQSWKYDDYEDDYSELLPYDEDKHYFESLLDDPNDLINVYFPIDRIRIDCVNRKSEWYIGALEKI